MTQAFGMLKAANNGGERVEHDFYPTPDEATHALLPFIADFPETIWEPACGDGAIARILAQRGQVIGTDLVDRGYGKGGVDFLATTKPLAKAMVTNPPFGKLAEQFFVHAEYLGIPYIAMLFNVNFWHAAKRINLWRRRPPSAVLALTWRLDFTGSDSPYFNCVWVVWRPDTTFTRYDLLERPKAGVEALL